MVVNKKRAVHHNTNAMCDWKYVTVKAKQRSPGDERADKRVVFFLPKHPPQRPPFD